MEEILNDLIKHLTTMLEINCDQKERLLEFVRAHQEYGPDIQA